MVFQVSLSPFLKFDLTRHDQYVYISMIPFVLILVTLGTEGGGLMTTVLLGM